MWCLFRLSDPRGGGERWHGAAAIERSCHSFFGGTAFGGAKTASLIANGGGHSALSPIRVRVPGKEEFYYEGARSKLLSY